MKRYLAEAGKTEVPGMDGETILKRGRNLVEQEENL